MPQIRWTVWLGWLPALALLLVPAASAAADPVPELAEIVVARTRVEKKVSCQGLLRNRLETDLARLRIVLEVLDAGKIVRTSAPMTRGVLAHGRACRVYLAIPMCPQFSGYRIRVQAEQAGQPVEWVWGADSPADPPLLQGENRRGAQVRVLNPQVAPGTEPGVCQVKGTLRNDGDVTAPRAAVRVRFLDAADIPVFERTVIAGEGELAAGAETSIAFAVRGVPAYARATVDVAAPQGAPIKVPPGDFSDDPLVEAAEFRFERSTDTQVVVAGQVRNGLDHLVRAIQLTVILDGEDGKELRRDEVLVPGPLYPTDVRRFVAVLDGVIAFAAYRYEVAYEEDPEVTTRPPGDVEPPDEVGGDGEVAPEPDPAPEASAGKSPAKKIGVAGLHVVSGEFVGKGKSMTYTGDVYVLKLKFYDEHGNAVKQTGTLEVLFSSGGKPKGKASRPVGDGVYKLDWTKLKPKQVGEMTVAFDAGTSTLYAAVLRHKDQEKMNWQMEVRFTSKEKERWTFWKLEEPWESEPQAPDAPAKGVK